jgi:hypothetical protein
MSIIVADKERIGKSPLNNSTSKAMYSFSTAKRFQDLKAGG